MALGQWLLYMTAGLGHHALVSCLLLGRLALETWRDLAWSDDCLVLLPAAGSQLEA